MKTFITISFAVSVLLAIPAEAQFAGDLFFAEPSVTAASGATATMRVGGFFGSNSPAAVLARVTFPESDLVVRDVRAVARDYDERLSFSLSPGALDFLTQPDPSTSNPIGTIEFVDIDFEVTAASGTTVNLALQVRGALDGASSPYPSSMGFGGQIVVASSTLVLPESDGTETAAPLMADTWSEVDFATVPVPYGGKITRWLPVSSDEPWLLYRQEVFGPPHPSVPSDAIR